MQNSSRIAAALIIGFIVFITMRGELPRYFGVLGINQNIVGTPTSTTDAKTSNTTITIPSFPGFSQ